MPKFNASAAAGLVAALGILLVAIAPAATAQTCQTPLFVQASSVEANVMLLVDDSGSMGATVVHSDYDATTFWPGGQFGWLWVGSDGPFTRNGRTIWLSRAWYDQNYTNWMFWHATADQRASMPTAVRIDVVHDVFTDFVANAPANIRMGLASLNTGGNIILPCGTDRGTLITAINNINASGGTPLAQASEGVLEYFKRTGGGAPIDYPCQKNFVITMTDGWPNNCEVVSPHLFDADGDGNPEDIDCGGGRYSGLTDDVAYWSRHNDLRDDLGDPGEDWADGQTLVTYTIGFNIDAGILVDAAANGHGIYYNATDAGDLTASLEFILQDVLRRLSSGAAVAVVSTERGTDDHLFRGKFMPGDWTGYLEAFDLPYSNGDSPVWEAGAVLVGTDSGTRVIKTALGTTMYDLTTGQAASLYAAMGLPNATIASDVIHWTRGNDVAGLRDRDGWKLGDIIHSTPVVVGAPAAFHPTESYDGFMTAQSGRTPLVYAGANDGMLHAFRVSSGAEVWAFVPECALPTLADIADSNYCHVYSVDQTPTVEDVYINGSWRTVLVGGQREGGAGYFALDVTNAATPSVLWQITLPNNMPFSSEPEIVNIGGTYVVLMGSGLDETNGEALIYEYDLETGNLIDSMLMSTCGGRNRATRPTTVDQNLDGEADVAYMGDVDGNVWRMAFNGTTSMGGWTTSRLYDGNREITAAPAAAMAENGVINVYFGTGAYLDNSDLTTHDGQRFICVFDFGDGADNPHLENQTGGIHDVDGEDGWYIDLEQHDRERVTEPAAIVAEAVFFTSFAPNDDACAAGGDSWVYRLSYDNGDVPDDGESDTFDGDRVRSLGAGVASRAVVDVVNETVIIQGSDATIHVEDIGQTYFHLSVRSWQENYEHVVDAPAP